MAENKKSFIIYTDSRGMVNKLSNERAGILFKTLFSYCDDENPICEDEVVDMAFEHFKNILKRDLKKYENIIERNRQNGKSGGRPKNPVGFLETEEKRTEPKKADNDTDNVNVNVTDNVINKNNIEERKLKFSSTLKPFLETYGKDLLNDFYKYWTEPNKSNTKFKQELEKTWSLERRLETWSKNDKSFNKTQTIEKTIKKYL